MAEIRYGYREGAGKGKEYKIATDQYFHRLGGHFVYDNSAGEMVLATTNTGATPIVGWLQAPKDTSGYNSWKSSSGDKGFVITGLDNRFEIPVDKSVASANATLVGKGAVTNTTGTTYDMKQQAAYKATAASCNLIIHDYDSDNQTVLVSIRPSEYMV